MSDERAERCERCRFWLKGINPPYKGCHPDDWPGECRRYPPRIVDVLVYWQIRQEVDSGELEADYWDAALDESSSDYNSQFPVSQGGDWCGEFQPIKTTDPS